MGLVLGDLCPPDADCADHSRERRRDAVWRKIAIDGKAASVRMTNLQAETRAGADSCQRKRQDEKDSAYHSNFRPQHELRSDQAVAKFGVTSYHY